MTGQHASGHAAARSAARSGDAGPRATPGRLDGLVAVVTGGGSGIGRAVVDRFLTEGARVSVLERDREVAESLRDCFGGAVSVTVGDVRDPLAHQEVVERSVSRHGRLDVHVSNAGVYDHGRVLEDVLPDELTAAFRELFEVNVLGYLLGARAAAPELRRTGGTLLFTVSSSGTFAGGGGALYVGSKHAVNGVLKQLAHELAPDVRVNGVAPGATRTGLAGVAPLENEKQRLDDDEDVLAAIARSVPLGFVSDPDDHAGLYVTLADPRDSRFMTGVVIASDGGLGVGRRPPRARNSPTGGAR